MAAVRESHGFTLLELIVALAITTTLAGTALLGYQQMAEELHLNHAARQVMLDLASTRTRALAENVGRRLVFLADRDAYQPQRQNGSHYDDDGVAVSLPAGIDLTDCTAASSAITFRPRGNASTFGTITLRNGAGHERRVVIDIAGRIRVE
jgi:prepilin-type N-terminal cleavage/methylation domain-containing protein